MLLPKSFNALKVGELELNLKKGGSLINSVTLAISTNVMPVFCPHLATRDNLYSLNNNFFWGKIENNNNNIHVIELGKI